MSAYTFPFSTCEVPTSWIFFRQPFSVITTLLSTGVLTYHWCISRTRPVKTLFTSLCLFEINHAVSHAIHVPGTVQVSITHALAYFVNFSYLQTLRAYTGKNIKVGTQAIVGSLVLADVYAWFYLPFLYYLSTQFFIFLTIFLSYYSQFPLAFQKKIPSIVGMTLFILLLFYNESLHCDQMLSFSPLPYHTLIETCALMLVIQISRMFRMLDTPVVYTDKIL